MFTVIYSQRVGTKAAALHDPFTRGRKAAPLDRLLRSKTPYPKKACGLSRKNVRVLIDGRAKILETTDRPHERRQAGASYGPQELKGSFAAVKKTDAQMGAVRRANGINHIKFREGLY
jgi:tRNA A37 methylthiotransferase MiaB